jgi:hypothetical protein
MSSQWSQQSPQWCASICWSGNRQKQGSEERTFGAGVRCAVLAVGWNHWTVSYFPVKSCYIVSPCPKDHNEYWLIFHRSDSVPSSRLIVTMECANLKCQRLGFTDVASTDLLAQCTEENHGTSSIHLHTVISSWTHGCLIEFSQELIRTSDSPAQELVSFCSFVPLEILSATNPMLV